MVFKSSVNTGSGGSGTIQQITSSGATIVITNPTGPITNLESAAGGGNVNTTGSPALGNIAIFSGATTITNGNLAGDVTTSGSPTVTLATVNTNVGTYGSVNSAPIITVNAKGLVTGVNTVSLGAGSVSTTGSPAVGNLTIFSGSSSITNTNLAGDVTTSGGSTVTLATVNSNIGSYGSTSSVPIVVVNAKGLTTGVSTASYLGSALSGTSLATGILTSSLTKTGTLATATWQASIIGLPYGGTNADLSASGGTSNVLKQVSSGAAVTVGQLAASDLSNGTTGSGGGVVLATGPTLSSPLVGTQTSSDNSTKAASTAYVTTAITNALNGLDWKPAAGYATTANVIGTNTAGVFTYTSTGVDTIDGHTLVLNDVVLFKNQTTGADNGVWVVTTAGSIGVAGVLTRRSDYNAAADIHDGDTFFVQNGTVNAGTSWVQTNVVNTINSDALAFSQVAGPGTYTAGNGISITSNVIALSSNAQKRSISVTFDGGGSALTSGKVSYLATIPYAGNITAWDVVADQSGSAVIDVWKTNAAVPTVANTITASAKPTISSAQSAFAGSISGWSASVSAGDVFGFHLDSATTVTSVTLTILITIT